MVSHCATFAETPNSAIRGGRATLNTVSLRIMTNAENASTAIVAVIARVVGAGDSAGIGVVTSGVAFHEDSSDEQS
ncbi:hypothetical protein GCM10009693_23000 [Leucobacter chromiireducens subsp. chromiireducens]